MGAAGGGLTAGSVWMGVSIENRWPPQGGRGFETPPPLWEPEPLQVCIAHVEMRALDFTGLAA